MQSERKERLQDDKLCRLDVCESKSLHEHVADCLALCFIQGLPTQSSYGGEDENR